MVKIFFIIVFVFMSIANAKSPKHVEYVDYEKFSGLWYEIARTYNKFEENCVAPTVEYIVKKPFKYDIINRCFDKKIGAKLTVYNGVGRAILKDTMSIIKATYFWVFSQEYKVVYLGDDYSSFVMIDDEMDSVWIMSKTPFMDVSELKKITSMLGEYMDISRLIYPIQDENGRYK